MTESLLGAILPPKRLYPPLGELPLKRQIIAGKYVVTVLLTVVPDTVTYTPPAH